MQVVEDDTDVLALRKSEEEDDGWSAWQVGQTIVTFFCFIGLCMFLQELCREIRKEHRTERSEIPQVDTGANSELRLIDLNKSKRNERGHFPVPTDDSTDRRTYRLESDSEDEERLGRDSNI